EVNAEDLLAKIITQAAVVVQQKVLTVPKVSSVHQTKPPEFQQQLAEIRAKEERDKETDADMTRLLVQDLNIEKSQFNPVRYKQRNDFKAELGKVHQLKQNVWKTVVIK
ncbi:MAG: hypothetical protein EZS28_038526, partial [Streblomastix strix]